MNGIIDQQVPTWNPPPRRPMLHENLRAQTSPNANDIASLLVDLDVQMETHNREFDLSLETLRGMYIFADHKEVAAYLRLNRAAVPILIEAFPHLARAFSESPVLLDVMTDGGFSDSISVLALWWGKREEAKTALQSFDDSWWLDNIRKSGGKIIFDYQIEK